jgi:predicted ATPase with chaperone activity
VNTATAVIVIVGLPDPAVKESRDCVSTALTNSGFKFPVDPVRQEAP